MTAATITPTASPAILAVRTDLTPLGRYRAIVAALHDTADSSGDRYWLRFAAQAAVLCPESPHAIAAGIRRLAEGLLARADWYQGLTTPARFVVAALLVQHHLPMRVLVAGHKRSVALLQAAGLPHRGFAATMGTLIMHLAPSGHGFGVGEAQRLKAIYSRMRRFHWWITGPADLPACAALAQCPSTAEVIVARVEDIYQQLHAGGLTIGNHLHTAACLLSLSGLSGESAVARDLELERRLARRYRAFGSVHYDAISVLALLDHDPEVVVARLDALLGEVRRSQGDLDPATAFTIASDLAFLQLHTLGPDLAPIQDAHAMQARLRILHTFHIAVAVLMSHAGDFDATAIPTPMWPMSMA
jgi:hypothetical protein